jgi:hypothetical protein
VVDCAALPFKSVTVWHSCGHNERHAMPRALDDDNRARIASSLSEERCWRCVLGDAWSWLLSRPTHDL